MAKISEQKTSGLGISGSPLPNAKGAVHSGHALQNLAAPVLHHVIVPGKAIAAKSLGLQGKKHADDDQLHHWDAQSAQAASATSDANIPGASEVNSALEAAQDTSGGAAAAPAAGAAPATTEEEHHDRDKTALYIGGGLLLLGGGIAAAAGGGGGSSTPVTPANVAPTGAATQAVTTNEDTAATVTVVATDANNDPLTYTAGAAAHGTVTGGTAGAFTYTPTKDYNGADSFVVTVSDGKGGTFAQTVNLTVTAVNDAPVAVADTAAATEGAATPVTGSVATNDSDIDSATLTYTLAAPVAGLTLNANGTYSFDPRNAAYQNLAAGATRAVVANYSVSDGALSAASTLTITVTGVNTAPVAVADTAAATEDAAVVTGSVATNDSDPDSTTLTYTLSAPVAGLTLNANGSYSFDPSNAAYQNLGPGATRAVVANYTVSDGALSATSTLTITVTGVNDAPTIDTAATRTLTVAEDSAAGTPANAFIISASDVDLPAQTLTPSITTAPAHGAIVVSGGNSYYVPSADYNGPDSFVVSVTDSSGAANARTSYTVNVNVTPVNDAPVARPDVAAATEDAAAVTGSVATNDTDIDSTTLTYALNAPVAGLTLNANGSYSFDPSNAAYQNLGPGATRAVVANYTVSDGGTPNLTATSTLTITVTGVNDAPVAVADTNTATEDGAIKTGSVATNDSDIDLPAQTLTYALAAPVAGLTLNANGSYSFDPSNAAYQNLGAGATRAVVANYTVSDGVASTPSTLTITVTGVNDAPTFAAGIQNFTAGEASTTVATPITVTATATDIDVGDTLTYTAGNALGGSVTGGAGGVFTYSPNALFYGTDSFTVTANDGKGGTATQVETILVQPNLDIDSDASTNTAQAFDATKGVFIFTDSATVENNAVINGFAANDIIRVNAPESVYSFSSSNDGSSATKDDITITYNNGGVVSQIVLQDVIATGGGLINSQASAEAAVGYDFFQSTAPALPLQTASLDIDNDGNVSTAAPFSGASAQFTFTDDAGTANNAVIRNFGVDDLINANGAGTYSFTSSNDGSSFLNDITISLNQGGIVSQIVIQDVANPNTFVSNEAQAEAAVGFDFFRHVAVPPPPPPPPGSANIDVDSDNSQNTTTTFNAATNAFTFTDNANVANNATITNVGADDHLTITNAVAGQYSFSNTGTTLDVTFNGPNGVNELHLVNAVSANAFIFNEATAEAALGAQLGLSGPLDFFQFA